MKKVIIAIIAVAAVLMGVLFAIRKDASQGTSFKTAEITRGSVEETISSTGSLNPVSTIEVGTQVSGTIVKVNVDYNDVVKKNQIIAEIDRKPLLSKLTQVQASYSRAEAMFEQAKVEYERNKPLHTKGLISDEEFTSTKTSYLAQKASLDAAKADVETAQTNLDYAIIRSPIDGTVIKKSVEVGQTVAASLSAPTLFIIAEDLQKMEILANVDESDIGRIKTGQDVSFSVPAYPDQTYKGKVDQIRLQPETNQNVVTYTVVIKAPNSDGTLLPGMTANVDFIAERSENTLLVPSAALRYRPSEDILKRLSKAPTDHESGKNFAQRRQQQGGSEKSAVKRTRSVNRGTIWILDQNNEIRPVFVQMGISDGSVTSITGKNIEEGLKVITGITDKKSKEQTKSRSLFTPSGPQSGRQMMPPPGRH